MRRILTGIVSTLILAGCVLIAARGGSEPPSLRLRLLDAETGKPMGGTVRVQSLPTGKAVELPGLLDRLRGLKKSDALTGWFVVPAGGGDTKLPHGRYRIEALSGLETLKSSLEFEVRDGEAMVSVKLKPVFRPADQRLTAGNTHLHLQGVTREECDEYLRQVPAADGIRVMFLSYLERAEIDKTYITNRFPIGPVKGFETTGVLFHNGEEHRHNFEAWGQGYGHVMFLNINRLVQPVSLGPGITAKGNDDRPLRPGIDDARSQGGTIIWCHNANGYEDVPTALSGRLDALNVFDGSRTGTYEESYYRFLNIGMRLPISTGTDWFIYDFSRVYARVDGEITIPNWLTALKAGRNQATNGPLLSFTVDGKDVGDTIRLDRPRSLKVKASALGRHDFQKLQVVHNGKVVLSEPSRRRGEAFAALIERDLPIDGPGWLALRIDSDTKNELNQQLFAHTSPVYLEIGGRKIFDLESAQALHKLLEQGRDAIRSTGKFSADKARDDVLAIYEQSIRDLTERIARRAK